MVSEKAVRAVKQMASIPGISRCLEADLLCCSSAGGSSVFTVLGRAFTVRFLTDLPYRVQLWAVDPYLAVKESEYDIFAL